jgi:RHS repeat-associated protein
MTTGTLARTLAVVLSFCLAVPAFSARMQAAPASAAPAQAAGQTATLLPNGSVLLAGGQDASGTPSGAIALWDLQHGERHLSVALQFARSGHTATVLPDGTVLILGGIGPDSQVVAQAEIFDPQTETVQPLKSRPPTARVFHSATLLTDGRVLIAGGVMADGTSSKEVELWDPGQNGTSIAAGTLTSARRNHTATLLQDGRVLLTGGKDGNNSPLSSADVFDPQTQTISSLPDPQAVQPGPSGITDTAATSPEDGAVDVPLDALISMRFTRPVQTATINDQTVILSGPLGIVAAKIVGAENGMLAFITPGAALAPGTVYSLKFSGALDVNNANVAFREFMFTTVADQSQNDLWTPNADWRTHNAASQWQSMPPLQAKPGVTALAGQVLKLDGTPLAHVKLQIGTQETFSDGTGRFLLTGLAAGHQVMLILGETANSPIRNYGVFEVGVDLQDHVTSVLNYTIWMTPLDTAHAVKIASPTSAETVITTPLLPGLELRLPANTVITDRNGKPITEISITPVPLDRPPFPLPHVPVPIYFTIQPGSAYIHVTSSTGVKGARLFYPNALSYPPGTPYQFWNYDASQKGWFIYGAGRVSANRAQIIPNPGVEIYGFTGAMVANPGNAPPDGPRPDGNSKDGEPVDLGTGLFVYKKTDLMLPDLIPLVLTRTYRQNDPISRSFGVGASQPYDMFMIGDNNTFPEGYTYQDLILADGGRIHFQRTSPCTGANGYCDFGNAVYEHTTSGSDFYGAIIRQQGCSPNGFWTLTKKDGTVYCFPDSDASNNPRSASPTSMRDRYGNTLNFVRDSSANLTQITGPSGRWIQFTYDASNRITQSKDSIGRTVSYSYDAGGRLTQVVDANGGTWHYTYDAFNQMTAIQDARGIFYLTNQYDTNGRVLGQTQGDNTNFQFSYTTDPVTGNITRTDVTDPRGTIRSTNFNANGYKTSSVFAVGQPEQQTITYNRDPNSNLVNSITDGLSHQTSFSYDPLGNLTSITRMAGSPDAVTTSFAYESTFNQLASVTDPLNRTTTLSHDATGSLTALTDPLGHQTTIGYNAQGLPVSVTDPLGNLAQFAYEGTDLVGLTDPLGNTTTRFVDGAGRVAAITDPLGRITRYTYNAMNQVVQKVDALQGTTSISYDLNGNPVSLTNAAGNSISWTYDNMDRMATRSDSLLRTESYTYGPAGNLASFTDRKGQVTTYNYDRLNRLIFVGFGTQGSGGSATYASTLSYQYDADNRLTQAVDSVAGTITHGYDTLDRLTSEATPQGSITYGYDAAGRKTSMTVAGQPSVSYGYDNGDRLTQISQATSTVTFSYDDADRRTSVLLPNGITISYGYDNSSQITGITYSLGGNVLGDLNYAYDQLGRRTQMGGSFARTNLPQPVSSASYDAANELQSWNGIPFSYDANGGMLSDGANTFTWDARNNLSALNGSSLQYDAFGRRTQNSAGTSFLYDSLNAVQELSGATVTSNMLTGNVDEIFSRSISAGTFTPLQDALGSNLALADATGTIQSAYTYDPYGVTSISGVAGINPFQFTGRENEGNGLYYYRARYYSPVLGRFISEDPTGLFGGDVNLYRYAVDNPTNFKDPKGKWIIPAIIGGIGAAAGGIEAGIHGYECGARGWDLAGDIGRGALSGGVGALAGALFENPFAAGAASSLVNDGVKSLLGENVSPGQAVGNAVQGAAFGGFADGLVPNGPGGWNFNKWTSPRTFGPKAMDEYAKEGISDGTNTATNLAGRNCSCD